MSYNHSLSSSQGIQTFSSDFQWGSAFTSDREHWRLIKIRLWYHKKKMLFALSTANHCQTYITFSFVEINNILMQCQFYCCFAWKLFLIDQFPVLLPPPPQVKLPGQWEDNPDRLLLDWGTTRSDYAEAYREDTKQPWCRSRPQVTPQVKGREVRCSKYFQY